MKLFALLPLASLFLGVIANPVSAATALDVRADANPVATLEQFTTEGKKYTDAIRKSLFFASCQQFLAYIRILT